MCCKRRKRARRENKTTGEVISELARNGLTAPTPVRATREEKSVYGFRPFAKRGTVVTSETVDRLREGMFAAALAA